MGVGRDRRLEAITRRLGAIGELLASHDAKTDLSRYAKYADDPCGFITHELKAELWAKQIEAAQHVVTDRFVVVPGCNGSGKDHLAGRLALWWAYCRQGLAIITGPSERQVKSIVMGELRRAWNQNPELPGKLYELALKLDGPEALGVLAFTSNDVSKITGFHAPRLLVIVTEAQGVEPHAWEGVLSCATGAESRILAVGNPLVSAGKFFDVSRSDAWTCIRIDGLEHPNVIEGWEKIPGSITTEFIEQMAREYGEGSGVYAARVRGRFPDSDEDTLAKRSWLDAAATRWEEKALVEENAPVSVAVDPARYGADQTALVVRDGQHIREIVTWGKRDTMESVGKVLVALEERNLDPKRTPIVCDVVGLGSGVYDRLREQGCKVVEFNGGKTPRQPAKFLNRRAEAFWQLRRALEEGEIALPRDPKLFDELAALKWKPTSSGKIQFEAKEEFKQRIGRSCDRADALAMVWDRGVEHVLVCSPGLVPKSDAEIAEQRGNFGTLYEGGGGSGDLRSWVAAQPANSGWRVG